MSASPWVRTPSVGWRLTPEARFVGIDLMPEHIAHAGRLAAAADVTNVAFHTADFAEPPDQCELAACGTAIRLAPALLRQLRDGAETAAETASPAANWARFFAVHTVCGKT